ncbi:MAG: peptide-methionine (R)-S-oxide reductase [Actinobacteria bacterium]|nr:peptide-methionine (R)-S-oxide reductase [Actinomycetota bacterium]
MGRGQAVLRLAGGGGAGQPALGAVSGGHGRARGHGPPSCAATTRGEPMKRRIDRSEDEWRAMLTPFEFHVLREAGTERAGTGELLHENREGIYRCRACGAELFRSQTKFDSHCGWPSFYAPSDSDAVELLEDRSFGMRRVEVRCASCGSHLGHVFPDAPQTPTGDRYCMNSVSLTFEEE